LKNLYPQSLTYRIPLNEKDYYTLDIDFDIDINNPIKIEDIKESLNTIFQQILKIIST